MKILVPIDGSACSSSALDVAIKFAGDLHAEIVLCYVVSLAQAAVFTGGEPALLAGCLEELQTNGNAILAEALARVDGHVAASSRKAEGEPIEEIVKIAADLQPAFIVIGSHGRSGLSRALMGSVAEGVLRRAPIPVMVVPSKGRQAA